MTWHSPIRVATDSSMYAMPESAIGLFCDVGGSYFLSHIHKSDPSVGLFLGITGARVKGKDLVKWGIATHYVPSSKLPELTNAIATNVKPSSTNEEILAIVNKHADLPAADAVIPDYE